MLIGSALATLTVSDLLADELVRRYHVARPIVVRNLPRKSYRVVEKLTGTVPRLTAAAFFSALPLCADRAGLLSCDDVTAAARMMAIASA